MSQLIKQLGSTSGKIPLVCFPFAGGYSASFYPLYRALKNQCQILAIEPPGHGTSKMPLIANFDDLIDIYMYELRSMFNHPVALFGHSMGGLVVYRLVQKLERRGIAPTVSIISGVRPPHMRLPRVSHLNDDELIDFIVQIGGISPEVLCHKDMLSFFLPAFRADFEALETFEHKDNRLLDSSVHVFRGEDDEIAEEEILGWSKWLRRAQFHNFAGGHMFLLSETEAIAKTVHSILDDSMVRSDA